MRIGMLGCGNIGTFLLEKVNKESYITNGKIVAVHSRNSEKTARIAGKYGAVAYETVDELLESELDLVVEVATIELVKEEALSVLKKGIPLIISSIGVFADENFLSQVKDTCQKNATHVYIPSGAVGGLDILQSAHALGGLKNVQVITRKPPVALSNAEEIITEKEIFSGSAKEAIQLFPRNMNIAIAVSLAGIGSERTEVKIIADPQIEKNMHTIQAKGTFGEFTFEVVNEAMLNNPKTSYLAALSVLASIQEQSGRLKIG